MIFCEQCRVTKRFKRPPTYPYHDHGSANCEVCGKYRDCYDYPYLFLKDRSTFTTEEIILDKRLQQEYHNKAEELIIAYLSGSLAGATDVSRSDELRNVMVQNNGEVDWYATYKLRQKVQEGYRKADEIKNRR